MPAVVDPPSLSRDSSLPRTRPAFHPPECGPVRILSVPRLRASTRSALSVMFSSGSGKVRCAGDHSLPPVIIDA